MINFKCVGALAIIAGLSGAVSAQETNLEYIGMPIGGIATGQLYLGGDGQLWNWDVFNIPVSRPNGGGDRYYLNPMQQEQIFENGFGIRVKEGDKKIYERQVNSQGFSDISFVGEYPVGKINYKDKQLPVEVDLVAFSPFIPTDADNSGLPATIMEYTVTSLSEQSLEVELSAWLQNMSSYTTANEIKGHHYNKVEKTANFARVNLTSDERLMKNQPDGGSMTIALIDAKAEGSANAFKEKGTGLYSLDTKIDAANAAIGEELVGGVKNTVKLAKGESYTFTFIISWHFPNVHLWRGDAYHWRGQENLRHYYNKQFKNAEAVSDYIIEHPELITNTMLWNETWYESSLPKDFLDRTFLNTSTLATTASFRFDDLTDAPYNEGRYYNAEGVALGHGTCTHVFHYEQAMGRVFPSLTRDLREKVDLGLAYGINGDEGVIGYRAEINYGSHDGRGYAVDGQAGTILRIYREHLSSPDNSFLKRNWKNIKGAMQYMIDHDKERTGKADGILEGIQYNTLDRMWYGKISWISGLYAAALRASEQMALIVGDRGFARECAKIAQLSYENISSELFNGEYFTQKLDPEHLDAPNTNDGCHIDQLLGQYWASQLGLGYIVPKEQVQTALRSIMKYNFVENYDEYLANADIPIARWYADGDEQGVIMCSFPRGGADKAPGKINSEWEKLVVGYFSEMWTGQEHALAALLLDEGMSQDALKVERAINERYSAKKRNPYNEVEYGNHYTRAMSSYGAFISASGFYLDEPSGIIGFDPKIEQENYRSAFIAGRSWGSYSQKKTEEKENYMLELRYGKIQLSQFKIKSSIDNPQVKLVINNNEVNAKINNGVVTFASTTLKAGDKIDITIE